MPSKMTKILISVDGPTHRYIRIKAAEWACTMVQAVARLLSESARNKQAA